MTLIIPVSLFTPVTLLTWNDPTYPKESIHPSDPIPPIIRYFNISVQANGIFVIKMIITFVLSQVIYPHDAKVHDAIYLTGSVVRPSGSVKQVVRVQFPGETEKV